MSGHARRLFVGNLSYATTAAALRSLFAECGEVVAVEVVTDRGYAFVTMASDAATDEALAKLDGKTLDDRPLHVVVEDDARSHAPFARVLRRALGYVRF